MPLHQPAEWAPQAATLLAWPSRGGDWGPALGGARDAIAAMAAALAPGQQIILVAGDREAADNAAGHPRLALLPAGRLRIVELPHDDIWLRDTAPIAVRDDHGRRLFLDFRFNGWGERYPWQGDDALAARLHASGVLGAGGLRRRDWVLEGGAIETDGAGTLLTTERCLLQGNRNPGLDRGGLETRLRDDLGARRILWLRSGYLAGDDTDGHVDTLVRFADIDHIVHQGCDDREDVHYPRLAALARELAALRTENGRPYRLTSLPLPRPCRGRDGRRLPAGYANFLLGNEVVLAPAYDDPADAVAHARLAACFPGRRLVAIDCRALISQNGALHCAAMQIPADA